MSKRRIFIKPSGNVIALCDNKLEYITDLGKKQIHRAADVEFNNDKGVWEIITPDGKVIGQNPRRDAAIELEIRLMEDRLKVVGG